LTGNGIEKKWLAVFLVDSFHFASGLPPLHKAMVAKPIGMLLTKKCSGFLWNCGTRLDRMADFFLKKAIIYKYRTRKIFVLVRILILI
jgi:hypothetical protein